MLGYHSLYLAITPDDHTKKNAHDHTQTKTSNYTLTITISGVRAPGTRHANPTIAMSRLWWSWPSVIGVASATRHASASPAPLTEGPASPRTTQGRG